MFDRISRSWALSRQSWQVLRSDKQLVLFPLISSLACFMVLVSFALPIFMTTDFEALKQSKGANPSAYGPAYYIVLFAFYFVNFTVISFFNAALIGCAMRKFDGEEVTVADGMQIAMSRLPQILGWALVSATVGMVLRMIAERSGFIGRIVIGLLGFVWTIATYFVVPVLVVEKVGPIEAVKRSGAIIRKTWGESLAVNLGLGALSFVGFLVSLVPTAIGIALTVSTNSVVPAAVGLGISLIMLVLLALITSTLKMILIAALYRYASTGLVPEQFDGGLLRQVFKEKKK